MKYLYLFVILILLALTGSKAYSQCTPDPNVTDPENNGEIYPLDLIFKVGEPVNLSLTIIPPPTAVVDGLGTINLAKIVLRNIDHKPSWMGYTSNANWVTSGTGNPQAHGYEFVVGQRYCVLLTGTPDGSFIGTDSMGVVVDAYVSWGMVKENTNGGYIKYTICAANDSTCHPTEIENISSKGFNLLETNPTFLNKEASIGFETNNSNKTQLTVYNILGQLIYTETLYSVPGKNYFKFNGNNFNKGNYIYTITDYKNKFSKKFVKME